MNLKSNIYMQDILSQPEALQAALRRLDLTNLDELTLRVQSGAYDRIILTGMGASFYGLYPAWLHLVQGGLPAHWIDCAELLHYSWPLINRRTLVWAVSQSGQSAEVLALSERLARKTDLLVTSNDPASPLAKAGKWRLLIDAPVEASVSTRTYTNTLALTQLMALRLAGRDIKPYLDELDFTLTQMHVYLDAWEEHLGEIRERVGFPGKLVLLGRGPSLAAALCGALIQAEAAKYPALGLQAAEFRHGPLEMVGEDLTSIIFAGMPGTLAYNLRLAEDISDHGGRVFWLSALENSRLPEIMPGKRVREMATPISRGIGLPLAEILPLQLLSVHVAMINGLEPGDFRHIGKVTLVE